MSSLVLITNRFDENLKLKLKTLSDAKFHYVSDLFADLNLLAKADGLIIRSTTKVTGDFFLKASQLKFIVTATSGFDHINLKAASERSVRCFHVPETQAVAAAELTLFLILSVCRKITRAQAQLKKGNWQRSLLLGQQLSGQSLGLIGLGRVGKEVAKRAQALDLNVSAYDPFITEHDPSITMLGFEELMRSSDIISLHVPKTKKTKHMIKKETLDWMGPESCLINMSRGDVINEPDLINHLQANPNFSAGLDVFAREPLAIESPLMSLSNASLTPHIGASTEQALRASSAAALEKALKLLKGESVMGALPLKEPWFES